MDNQVIVSDYTQMDRVLREERQYILDLCKKIKKAGCNVLLIQKSILRYVPLQYQYLLKRNTFPPLKRTFLQKIVFKSGPSVLQGCYKRPSSTFFNKNENYGTA